MRVIIINDKRLALLSLHHTVQRLVPCDAKIRSFCSSSNALQYALENVVDVALVDMELSGMHGLVLAKELQALNPRINLIFMASTSDYAGNAWDMHASGYLRKPVKQDELKTALQQLRFPAKRQYSAINV